MRVAQVLERCSQQAVERRDPLIGSAFPAACLLLVEQPGPWGRAGLLESNFDSSIAHRLVGVLDPYGIRVLAIRRPGRDVPGVRRWAIVDCRPGRERVIWGRFDDDRELLALDLPAQLESPVQSAIASEPEYLVCVHGTHDMCCAIKGRPVAAALRSVRPERVWESSHIGGDRFAANVLVLPSGLLYGQVSPRQAPLIVERTDAETADGFHLRGRIGFSPVEQAAIVFAHRHFPAASWRTVRIHSVDRTTPDSSLVVLTVDHSTVAVVVTENRAEPSWLSCQAERPGRVITYTPRLCPHRP